MYMAKVIESIVHRFVCSKLSFYNYSVHMWSVLGSRLELRLYFEVGKHRERAGILVQNEVRSEKYSNKAVQTDNSRAICIFRGTMKLQTKITNIVRGQNDWLLSY